MTTGLLITTAGQAAIAADLAGGADLVLSHVAFGDAGGVPYAPNAAQVALVNERYRATIASVAVVAGAIVIDAVIPADTPDGSARPSHGFNVAEAGIYSAAGTLIGVARMGNGYKPPPSSGQAAIATFRFKLAVANPSAIAVVIDPQAQMVLGRHVRAPWLTIDGVLNAPPGAPNQGDTYIVGAAPTGAWTGFEHRIAQWVGVWSLASAPIGHVVCDNSRAEDHASRFLKRTAGGWASAAATDTAFGFARRATDAEIAASSSGDVFVRPSDIVAAVSAAPSPPQLNFFDLVTQNTQNVGSSVVTVVTDLTVAASKASDAVFSGGGTITIGPNTAGVWAFSQTYIPGQVGGVPARVQAYLQKNGINVQNQTVDGTFCTNSGVVKVEAGDTLRMAVWQNSGVTQKNQHAPALPQTTTFNLYQISS